MKFDVRYNSETILEVEVPDTQEAKYLIREMVEFWANSISRVSAAGGSHTIAWLKLLAGFFLKNGRLPKDDEGWYDLDGTNAGIKVTWSCMPDFDDENIQIKEII
jgi:hypothetical protein